MENIKWYKLITYKINTNIIRHEEVLKNWIK